MVDVAVLGLWSDSVLEVFSKLNNSIILFCLLIFPDCKPLLLLCHHAESLQPKHTATNRTSPGLSHPLEDGVRSPSKTALDTGSWPKHRGATAHRSLGTQRQGYQTHSLGKYR